MKVPDRAAKNFRAPFHHLTRRGRVEVRSRKLRAILQLTRIKRQVFASQVVLAFAVAACNREPKWHGTPITPALAVPTFSFADSVGASIAFRPAAGEAAMVFFGYTNCPDVCPTTLSDWVRVRAALGDDANRVHFMFVSVDPERDTPAVAQRYAAQFHETFRGLSGSRETTVAVQKAFGVASAKEPSTSAQVYLIGHPAQTFLMDEQGRVRVSYTFGAGWDVMAADLIQLLR